MLAAPIIINRQMLDELSEEARQLPRLRKHRNFHGADNAPCHRLIIAIEPGSYIPPHCHADRNKDETISIVRGRIGMVFFDAQGSVTQRLLLEAGGETQGVTSPAGMFHSLLALEPGAVFLEAKAGPYLPPADSERPAWAPLENTAEAPAYLATMRALFGS
ncbi:MAG: WbuC family cupin fold metalloprotein [Burkholderiales bacterium]